MQTTKKEKYWTMLSKEKHDIPGNRIKIVLARGERMASDLPIEVRKFIKPGTIHTIIKRPISKIDTSAKGLYIKGLNDKPFLIWWHEFIPYFGDEPDTIVKFKDIEETYVFTRTKIKKKKKEKNKKKKNKKKKNNKGMIRRK